MSSAAAGGLPAEDCVAGKAAEAEGGASSPRGGRAAARWLDGADSADGAAEAVGSTADAPDATDGGGRPAVEAVATTGGASGEAVGARDRVQSTHARPPASAAATSMSHGQTAAPSEATR